MYALANVFRVPAERRPDLDPGVYAYARAGFGDYRGFLSASLTPLSHAGGN
jgi:arginine:ornithine antiporter / lysine permease